MGRQADSRRCSLFGETGSWCRPLCGNACCARGFVDRKEDRGGRTRNRRRDCGGLLFRHGQRQRLGTSDRPRTLVRSTASALSKSTSFAVTNSAMLGRETGRITSTSFSWTSAKLHEIAPPVARFLSVFFSGVSARPIDFSRAAGRGLGAASSIIGETTAQFARSTGVAL